MVPQFSLAVVTSGAAAPRQGNMGLCFAAMPQNTAPFRPFLE
jgi:hypothetical protein